MTDLMGNGVFKAAPGFAVSANYQQHLAPNSFYLYLPNINTYIDTVFNGPSVLHTDHYLGHYNSCSSSKIFETL